jgi:hypothetical protein
MTAAKTPTLQRTQSCMSCRLPIRAARSQDEILTSTSALLHELAAGADWAPQRDRAWLLAESAHLAEIEGRLDHAQALRCYDLLGALWGLCRQGDRGWCEIEEGRGARAMEAASGMMDQLDSIEQLLADAQGAIERIRGRARSLWQLADAQDEAAFLAGSGDHSGARQRAIHMLTQAAEIEQHGLLGSDELDRVEMAAARWGARPSPGRPVSWAS